MSLSNNQSTKNPNENGYMREMPYLKESIQHAGSKISPLYDNLDKLNILVLGENGAGKSTLIHSILEKHLHDTIDETIDETRNIKKSTNPNISLAFYEFLELNNISPSKHIENIAQLIEKQDELNDINEVIHCIFYCVDCNSHHFDGKIIQHLTSNQMIRKIPIFIVLTQSYDRESVSKMENLIKRANLNIVQIVPVLAKSRKIKFISNHEIIICQYGLDNLINEVVNSLPIILMDALKNFQQIKKKKWEKIITCMTAIAAATIVLL